MECFQIMFVLFLVYGSVIIMNLIVAIMINQMDEKEAEAVLMKQRIDEISTQTEIETLVNKKHLDDIKDFKVSVSLSANLSTNASCSSKMWSFLGISEHNVYRYTSDVLETERNQRPISTIKKDLLRNTVKRLQEKRVYLSALESKAMELQAKGRKEVNEILSEHQMQVVCTCPCTCGQDQGRQASKGIPRIRGSIARFSFIQ